VALPIRLRETSPQSLDDILIRATTHLKNLSFGCELIVFSRERFKRRVQRGYSCMRSGPPQPRTRARGSRKHHRRPKLAALAMDQAWRDRPKIGKDRNGCDSHLGHHRAKFPLYTKNQERLAQAIRWAMPSGSHCERSKIKIAQTQSQALVLLGAVGTDGRRTSPARLQLDVSGVNHPLVTAPSAHIACNRATARCIASTSAAVVSSLPLLHIPLKAAPSSMTILS
jgi:hypothetical protein